MMANPVSNDNLTQQLLNGGPRRTVRAGNEAPSREQGEETVLTEADEKAVHVSRAAELLNRRATPRSEGAIESAEQASRMAQGLKALFADQAPVALAAQGNKLAGLGELLKMR